MSERITIQNVAARAVNVNRRILSAGRHVQVERRNGYIALDEYEGLTCVRTITVGTKREVADFLHAMMVGIDLSQVKPEAVTPEALGIDTSKDGWFTEYEKRTKA